MGHTFHNNLYHIVFSTKDRLRFLTDEIRPRLFAYIGAIIKKEKNICLEINGVEDHIHVLAKVKPSVSIADFILDIKTGSSKWIHHTFFELKDFHWQSGYSCFSVSESQSCHVIEYIKNQEEHHKQLSFADELKLFLEKHNIEFHPQYYLD